MLNKKFKFLDLLILVVSLAITMAGCNIGDGPTDGIVSEITSIEEISNITVEYDTEFEDIDLPEDVEVTLDDNSTTSLDVNWLEGDYDGETADTYAIVGELELTNNITNPDNLYPTAQVSVQEEDITLYTVTVNYDDNKGAVTGDGDYEEGEEVELIAIPNEGYEFVEWTGYKESTEATVTFDMPAEDVELTAVFEEKEIEPEEYELTINIKGKGNTIPEEGTHEYEEGTTVNLEAIPNEGWKFNQWTGDVDSTDKEISVYMDGDKGVTAHFEQELAYFEVDITDYPEEVTGEGAEIEVEYEVVNTGDVEGTQDIEFFVNGELKDSEEITLTAGEIHESEFTYETKSEDVGEVLNMEVASDDDSESIVVKVQSDADIILGKNEIESINFSDSTSINITVPDYGDNERAYIVLFPRDEAGFFHQVGGLYTTLYDYAQEKHIDLLDDSITRKDRDIEDPFKPHPEFIREKEAEALQNHKSLSKIQRSTVPTKTPEIGDEEDFWVLDPDFTKKTAALEGKNDKALLWVTEDSEDYVSQDNVDFYLDEFGNYYDDLKDYFGREPESSEFPVLTETDGRVNILLSEMDYGGYFYSIDLYSQDVYENSNENKMIYINSVYSDEDFSYGRELTAGVIAHEFQHLLHYNEAVLAGRNLTEAWINEAFSELAQDIAGFGFKQENPYQEGSIEAYSEKIWETSVVAWEQEIEDYAASYLFGRYLYDQYGQDIIEEIYTSSQEAKDTIEDYFETPSNFYEIFQKYSLAYYSDSMGYVNFGDEDKYSFEIDLGEYPPYGMMLEPDEYWESWDIIGWGVGYTVIDSEESDELVIEIEDASLAGEFIGVAVRWEVD